MTLIIGVKCTNGIVMGADSAATLGVLGMSTVLQPVAKLSIVGHDQVIVGVSGPLGLGQLYVDRVDRVWDSIKAESVPEICRKLRDELLKDALVAFQVANLARQVVGSVAQQSALTHTMVALASGGQPQLVQFDYQCLPEVTTDVPFAAIGSGENIADPFLAFLRHVFWRDKPPNLAEGIFAAVWTLLHAIPTAPAGIGGPIRITTLTIQGAQVSTRHLEAAEIKEHEEAVDEAENLLRTFKTGQRPTPRESPPPTLQP